MGNKFESTLEYLVEKRRGFPLIYIFLHKILCRITTRTTIGLFLQKYLTIKKIEVSPSFQM